GKSGRSSSRLRLEDPLTSGWREPSTASVCKLIKRAVRSLLPVGSDQVPVGEMRAVTTQQLLRMNLASIGTRSPHVGKIRPLSPVDPSRHRSQIAGNAVRPPWRLGVVAQSSRATARNTPLLPQDHP